MSENQKKEILDINNMCYKLEKKELDMVKELIEKIIDVKVISLAPDAQIADMDLKEKLMLIDYLSLNKDEKLKVKEESIPYKQAIKELGLKYGEISNND